MSTEHGQLRLPDGVTEADLIDLADGRLSADREGVVLGALKADPALALMVRQMRGDAMGLAGLGQVHAPAGLAEGIEAKLQSQALRDLARESAVVAGAVPVSSVASRGPSPLRLVFENVWTRRLAAAAAVVIAAGAGMIGVREIARSYNKDSATHLADKTAPAGGGTETLPNHSPGPDAPAPTAVASIGDGGATATDGGVKDAVPTMVALDVPKDEGISEARAAVLAREGRLVVSVRAKIAAPVMKRLDVMTKLGREEAWSVVALDRPQQYAMLTAPSWEIAPAPVPTAQPGAPTTVAGNGQDAHGASPIVTPDAGGPAALGPRVKPVVKAIYTAEVSPDESGVAGLLKIVREGMPTGTTVVLRELAQGVTAEVVLDPEHVLWWTGTPGVWVNRARVPVVVEGLE